MKTNTTLSQVNYFTDADIYDTDVDNRPLYDLNNNIEQVNDTLGLLGYYIETNANPETEPTGGFSLYTCVYLGLNKLLSPIDISINPSIIDYTTKPIVLIIGKELVNNVYTYTCLAFAALYVLSKSFNQFLPSAVGKALKIGPGGELVDEDYFNLYYADFDYQSLSVGKVLTSTTIAFGGNQVATHISGNSFIAKNSDDITTGLLTVIRDTQDSNIVLRGLLDNTTASVYPFVEYQNYLVGQTTTSTSPIDVYFTNTTLQVDTHGNFSSVNDSGVGPSLNQVHFASPTISASSDGQDKYRTSGVNVGTLIDFSYASLLHSNDYSVSLQEVNQNISTSLTFIPSTSYDTNVKFATTTAQLGTSLHENLYPVNIFSSLSGYKSGVSYYDSTTSTPLNIYITSATDITPGVLSDDALSGPTISEFQNTSTLVIRADQTQDIDNGANILLSADKYLIAEAGLGFYYNSPNYDSGSDYEVATKGLLTKQIAVLQTEGIQNRIPLTGTEENKPITGTLVFDTTESTTPDVVAIFNTTSQAQIQSEYPVVFAHASSPSTTLQVLRARTPSGTLADPGTPNDLVNREFLESVVGGTDGTIVKTNTDQNISGTKTFTNSPIVSAASLPSIYFVSTSSGYGKYTHINSDTLGIKFNQIDSNKEILGYAKLYAETPTTADDEHTVVTKGYLTTSISSAMSNALWASWNDAAVSSTAASLLSTSDPSVASSNFSSFLLPYTENGISYYKNISTKTLVLNVSCTATVNGINISKVVSLNKISGGAATPIAKAETGAASTGYYTKPPWDPLTTDYKQWIERYGVSRGSATISHIVSIAPGEGFNFSYSNSAISASTEVSSSETSFTSFGSVQLLQAE